MRPIDEVIELVERRGDSQYGKEAITQREHALQAALAAEQAGCRDTLVVAALLHDVGHLLHELPEDAPEQGVDDHHENSGYHWLLERFGRAVADPVRLHVAAKRYLCAVEPDYFARLSGPSVTSLELQGGPFDEAGRREFEAEPYFADAVQLRRFDEAAKVPNLATPDLEHYRHHLQAAYQQRVASGGSPDA